MSKKHGAKGPADRHKPESETVSHGNYLGYGRYNPFAPRGGWIQRKTRRQEREAI